MYHNINDLIAKVNVIKDKADRLQSDHKYQDPVQTQFEIDDIQALCADIANDRGQPTGGEEGF